MALKENIKKLLQYKGATAAVLTPYDKNGEVNVSMIGKYVKYLTDNQCNGVYVTGTTGEGYSLTNNEKIAIATEWSNQIKNQGNNLLFIVNVTSTCIKEALQLTRECEKLKVDAIAVLPPNYYKPTSIDDLINYLKLFADAAPNTPMLYYHIPSFTGELPFDIVDFVGVALKKIPQFSAMKFTDSNIIRFSHLQMKYKNNFKIFAGFDETLVATLFTDECTAAVCALFSFPSVIKSYHAILEAYKSGDITTARVEQKKIIDECVKHKTSGNFFYSIKSSVNNNVKSLNMDFGVPRPPIYYN